MKMAESIIRSHQDNGLTQIVVSRVLADLPMIDVLNKLRSRNRRTFNEEQVFLNIHLSLYIRSLYSAAFYLQIQVT